jgi:hypothetical protein
MKIKIELAKEKMTENEIRAAEILKLKTENPMKIFKKIEIINWNGFNDGMIFWLYDNRNGRDIYYIVIVNSIVHQIADVDIQGHETIWAKMLLKTKDYEKAADVYRKGNSVSIDEMENSEEIKKVYNDVITVKRKTKSVVKRVELLKSMGYQVQEESWFDTKKMRQDNFDFYRLGNLEHKQNTYTLENGEIFIDNMYRSPSIDLLHPYN